MFACCSGPKEVVEVENAAKVRLLWIVRIRFMRFLFSPAYCGVDVSWSTQVVCAKRSPIAHEVKEGETYHWCTCGLSKNQPFCDGSHAGTKFVPQAWTATASETKYFCACKQTAGAPFCDGKHTKMPEDAEGKSFAPNSFKWDNQMFDRKSSKNPARSRNNAPSLLTENLHES
jgi:CDGSH iron-sulfur domain-containing protein 3